MESVLDKGSELLDSWGASISAGPIPAPTVQILGRFVQLSMWSREAKSEKLFTPFFLLAVSRGRGQKKAVCVF